jgi:hypothetical protein
MSFTAEKNAQSPTVGELIASGKLVIGTLKVKGKKQILDNPIPIRPLTKNEKALRIYASKGGKNDRKRRGMEVSEKSNRLS